MSGIVVLVDDLFFQSKLLETARQIGVELRICTNPDALNSEISDSVPRLVIVDLNASSHPIDVIKHVRSVDQAIPVVAYFSHVQTDLADKARAAGCPEVMPRSKFTLELATILARAKSESP